ncbi:polyketide cyclase [Arthrobacter pityocampae]|uniref:Polyketide cyclase n=1 Tax=Arthrobacter pityocampae TaxID=547334 RepID=A0A2S5IY26_9MICC|nr:SRPBCC domain-containing protein [Arthrobacter pityocampae]PPB49455.1 polyketide cyclase [Arthrobacter pityocampae]
MGTAPLGRRETRDDTEQLVFTRSFAATIADVWTACTDPGRMQGWIGTWTGAPASGEIVLRMTAEGDDVPEEVYLVEVCEPPRRLRVRSRDSAPFSADGSGPRVAWQHTLELSEADGATLLQFTQAVPDGPVGAAMAASVGPGWDYYLDRLDAVIGGTDTDLILWEPYLGRSEGYRALFSKDPAPTSDHRQDHRRVPEDGADVGQEA